MVLAVPRIAIQVQLQMICPSAQKNALLHVEAKPISSEIRVCTEKEQEGYGGSQDVRNQREIV